MTYRNYLFFAALLLANFLYAQQQACTALEKPGKKHIENGDLELALDFYSSQITKVPKECKAQFVFKTGLLLQYLNKNIEALPYLIRAKELAHENGNAKLEVLVFINSGAAYTSLGELAKGLYEYKQALNLAQSLKDDTLIAITHFNLAHNYKEKALFKLAISHLTSAGSIFEKIKQQKKVAKCHQTLGNVYRELDKDSLSLYYHHKALDLHQRLGNNKVISSSLNDLGNTYKNLLDHKQALQYYFQSLKIGDSTYKSVTFGNIAEVYQNSGDLKHAEEYFQKAIFLRQSEDDTKSLAYIETELGGLYILTNEWEKAHRFLGQGMILAQDGDYKDILLRNTELQQKLAESEGDLESAYNYLKKHAILNKLIFNKESQQAIEQATILLEVRDLEKENTFLFEESSLQKAIVQQERTNKRIWIMLAIIAIILVLIIWYAYRQSHKYANLEQVRRQEIQHRTKNFLQTLTNLFHFQASNAKSDDVKAIVKESKGRVEAMTMIHHTLGQDMETFYFTKYAKELIESIQYSFKDLNNRVKVIWEVDEIILKADQATPLALILNELVTNAFKYGLSHKNSPKLTLKIRRNEGVLTLEVQDNGPGLENTNIDDMASEGLKLVKLFVKQLQGSLEFINAEGAVVRVIIKNKADHTSVAG